MPCSHHEVQRPVFSSRCLYCVPDGFLDMLIPGECHLHLQLVANRDGAVFLCPGLSVVPEQPRSLLDCPVAQFMMLPFFTPLPMNLHVKLAFSLPFSLPPSLFLPSLFSLSFFLLRPALVPLFAFLWSWYLLYILFEFLTLALSYNTILTISKQVRLPGCFLLFPKGYTYFLKSFPRIKWQLQKPRKWCLKWILYQVTIIACGVLVNK